MRIRSLLVAVLTLTLALSACGKPEEKDERELGRAIDRTERLARRFIYKERAKEREVLVQGLVEDDLRYKARVTIGGTAALDEVASDDTLAVRLLDPGQGALFAKKDQGRDPDAGGGNEDPTAGGAAAKKDKPGTAGNPLEGNAALKAFAEGRWLLDRSGAPPLTAQQGVDRKIGEDPVFDALTTLQYVRAAMGSGAIRKFNEDALDYRPAEDPFAKQKPNKGNGEVRYDFVRPLLPRLDQATQGGANALPSDNNFRFLAVFVRKGVVYKVLENIQITGKLLEKTETYARAFIKERFPQAVKDFDRALKASRSQPVQQRAEFLLLGINEQRKVLGVDPVRLRSMSYDLIDLGADISVVLPAEQFVEADLSILVNRGKAALRQRGDTNDPNAGGSTTTTAPQAGGDSGNPAGVGGGDGGDGGAGGTAPAGDAGGGGADPAPAG